MGAEEETESQWDSVPVKVKTKKRRKRAAEEQLEQVERMASEEQIECQRDSVCVKPKTKNKIKKEAFEQPVRQASEEEIECQQNSVPVKVKTKKRNKKAVEPQVEQVETAGSEEETEMVEQNVAIKEEVFDGNWCQIFVQNIPTVIQKTHLQQFFSRYGEIQDLSLLLPEGRDTASSIIVFKNHEDAVKALEVNGMQFMGHELRVKRKIKHSQKSGQQTKGPKQLKQKREVQNNYEQPGEGHSYSSREKYGSHTQFRNNHQPPHFRNHYQSTQYRNHHQPTQFNNYHQPTQFGKHHGPAQFRNYRGHSGPQKRFTEPRQQPTSPIQSSQSLKLEDVQ